MINAWKAGPDLPARLHHEMAVAYKDELVVIGGWVPKGDNPSGEVSDRVFALRGGNWVELPSLNRARAAGAAAVVGDRIVVVGGQADDHLVPTTEVFDGKRWTTAADIPTAARAPRRGLGRALPLRRRWTGPLARPELARARALRPRGRQLGAPARHADRARRPRRDDRRRAAVRDRRRDRDRRDEQGRVLRHRRQAWSSAPSMRTPRHGITATPRSARTVYALGGATRPGHATAIGDRGSAQAHALRRPLGHSVH